MTIRVFAPAKINLTLHVTGQTKAGYHLLHSLVVFADVGDSVQLLPAPDIALDITGPFAKGLPKGPENLVWRAAEAAGCGVHIALEKNLPPSSGIGGGSSDAAAVLRGMRAVQGAVHPDPDTVLKLGADVPACLLARPLIMTGIGEGLTETPWPDMHAVLVNPGVEVPTAPVFQKLSQKDNAPMDDLNTQDPLAWLAAQRNDLEAPAIAIAPIIATVLDALTATGAQLARMSGSGATCFGLYQDAIKATAAAQQMSKAQPNWWVNPTLLGAPHIDPVSE